MIHLILGGARSGKSAYAEEQSRCWQNENETENGTAEVVYLATARSAYRDAGEQQTPDESVDQEMLQRIEHHRNRRPQNWLTHEEPILLAQALQDIERGAQASQRKTAVLIDCLTLWMLNLIDADCREEQSQRFLQQLEASRLPIFIVSNEVGLGVVPLGRLSREFVDELGRLHQQVAKRAHKVTFVTAGLPMCLKDSQ
ncbi:bifunctional adenosylcobinamide kinase/adenosylcobinamide-phosphate guanylyltransferase [Thiomicrorhabdus sp. 6S3-12]|uniref:bifunctional adenosylcobinamide kinase/adenosylcobinamide-phosphate guanylyltransferase n=1 Tax=Thiomicrorhabdus sp. 6S3-12 TaxID=2819681 RepID=UPI001AAD2665|nr:bifunctional adenosylcobinamide kinase/adenosylcobinamide-phosphate guanylyltransferase [Thiomicrorhabdus sp. 6S3-12]MBO1924110.1 bifunctional adenosylcobinamide kinase/adenosylcobinamide-phosphate guanylyltransferase [Thiomicrorhabdus sp. 6S3-12]